MKRIIYYSLITIFGLSQLTACNHSPKATEQAPVRVKMILPVTSQVAATQDFSGSIEATGSTILSFPVIGTINSMKVSEGDRVAAGQLIATLDASNLQNAYEIAKATLAQATDAYERMKKLHDANALPEMKWVEVQNTLKQAQSAEAIARKGLNDAKLHSVSAGYVAERMADVGMNVASGQPIAKIVDIKKVKAKVSVAENDIANIALGSNADVKVSALGDMVFSGKVTEKGVSANPLSRTYDVKIEIDNHEGNLLPGMICEVNIERQAPESATVLPINAVLLDAENNHFVWVSHQGVAAKHIVNVEGMTDNGIIVSAASLQGDSVIIEGQQKVSNGTKVVNI